MSNLPPSDLDRALARQKSYTFACVAVMLLYLLLWVPGAVANYLFLQEAQRMEDRAGEPLPGVTGLRLMWTVAVLMAALFALFCLFIFFTAMARGFR